MALVCAAIKHREIFVGTGADLLNVVLVMMIASRKQNDSAIISITLKNGGDEMTILIGVAIQHRFRDFCRGGIGIAGCGVSSDGSIVMGNMSPLSPGHLKMR